MSNQIKKSDKEKQESSMNWMFTSESMSLVIDNKRKKEAMDKQDQ